jgi:hypothetical protein
MIYANDLPVILVEEKPVCRGKISERDLRKSISEFNSRLNLAAESDKDRQDQQGVV